MTKEHFAAIQKILDEAGCDWSYELDNYGQVMIYTGVTEDGKPVVFD